MKQLIFIVMLALGVLSRKKVEDTNEYTEDGWESVVNKIMIYAA